MSTSSPPPSLVVGTRIHLGNASAPPEDDKYKKMLQNFSTFAASFDAKHAYVAADATPKFENYSLVEVLRNIVSSSNNNTTTTPTLQIIPVTPWSKFTPALNAIATRAANDGASHLLFCSAETQASAEAIQLLLQAAVTDDTLVAGAVLPGHDYTPHSKQLLNGTTTPWNTLAIWNVAKLTLTGFPLVADGCLHTGVPAGVEEVSAIALLQKVLGRGHAKAKLIPLPDITWQQTFEDQARQEWHDAKMKSKIERPAQHLELLQLKEEEAGVVEHC